MEDFKVRSCRLCLTVVDGENFELIDILDARLLKLDFDNYSRLIICNVCKPKLCAALKFKSTCLDTEATIMSYANDASTLPINLNEIYMKGREFRHNISDGVKICRFCMQPIKNISEIKLINDDYADMMRILLSEMNIFTIKEPVMCEDCLNSLTAHYNFLKKFLDAEQNIGDISNGQIPKDPAPIPSLHTSVKIEDVDIKLEDDQPTNQIEFVDINCDGIKIDSEIKDEEIYSQSAACLGLTTEYCASNDYSDKTNRTSSLNKNETGKHKKNKKFLIYKCPNCNYETNRKDSLTKHMLVHTDPSKVQMYKCKNCNYETKYKNALKIHTLKHKDPSQVEMFKCDICSYKSSRKQHLITHMLKHKDPSEVPMYKCENCEYQTKYKQRIQFHMLIHRAPSEVQMYKCDKCDYETKYNNALKMHMLHHQDQVETYKCEICAYKSCRKGHLKNHMVTHKDPSEVQMYKCESCDYQTKFKRLLKIHMLIHKDPSEVQMYKCEFCSHETRHKNHLKTHLLTHKDPSEVQMYKCENCDYQTKFKRRLRIHMLKHRVPSVIHMYKCEFCSYETKYKIHLKTHILRHKDPPEVQVYKCAICTYETSLTGNFNRHMTIHKDLNSANI